MSDEDEFLEFLSTGGGKQIAMTEGERIGKKWALGPEPQKDMAAQIDRMLIRAEAAAYQRGVKESHEAFQDEYSKHDDPFIGIIRGLAAILALEDRGQEADK